MAGCYGFTILEAEDQKNAMHTEHDLAELYAKVSNAVWTVEDDVYDFEEGTKQHAWAVEHTERWFALYHQLQEMIFEILRKEGIQIPATKRIVVLIPFMQRNGYAHSSAGWHRLADERRSNARDELLFCRKAYMPQILEDELNDLLDEYCQADPDGDANQEDWNALFAEKASTLLKEFVEHMSQTDDEGNPCGQSNSFAAQRTISDELFALLQAEWGLTEEGRQY